MLSAINSTEIDALWRGRGFRKLQFLLTSDTKTNLMQGERWVQKSQKCAYVIYEWSPRDGELRIKCKGTIAAEFWKRDVENVYSTDRDTFVYVLEMKETQWPGKLSDFDKGQLISEANFKVFN